MVARRPVGDPPPPAEGARRGSEPPSSGLCARSRRRWFPGIRARPTAEREIPVAEPLAAFLSKLPARTVEACCELGLVAIEWLPFPWRFSRMSLEARAEYLAKMESSRFSLYRDLLLLAKLLSMVGWARDQRVRDARRATSRPVRFGRAPRPRGRPAGRLPRGAMARNATS